MAVEVMQQACRMAGMEPSRPAVVFASRMSDMETTDAMCRVLARSPRLVSPTKFHNSVHNAAAGYWSIATSGRMPANAISAFDTSPSIALLEAAAQLHVEGTDVLVVMQDAAPPVALQSICQPAPPFAAALLLRPPAAGPALLRCRLETSAEPADWPDLPVGTPTGLDRNTSARILPLLAAAVSPPARPLSLHFPAATRLSLRLVVQRASG
jgi:hypothetical protein